jgi:hypothetical protein
MSLGCCSAEQKPRTVSHDGSSQPPAALALCRIEDASEVVLARLTELEAQLYVVLKPEPPSPVGEETCMVTGQSPLVLSLVEHEARLNGVGYRLQRLIQRLEI